MVMPARVTVQRLGCLARAVGALVHARLRVALCDPVVLADFLTKDQSATRYERQVATVSEAWLRDLAWAINGLSRRLPFRADCLVRVMAVEQILRNRAPFEIHVGAGVKDDRFSAHAWLTCQGIELTGGAVHGLERLERLERREIKG